MSIDLDAITLKKGGHKTREGGMCVMEAAAFIAGKPHSASPPCVCPKITDFMISWNDSLPSDEDRDRLLKPLLPLLIGTKSTKAVELRRSWMAFDWLVREHAPAWMDLTPALKSHAEALHGLGEIVDADSCALAMPVLHEARKASAAAGDAAGDAAGAAARSAAWDAAGDAAWAAAGAAARSAAWDAAGDAAWAAAGDAARSAAWAAAGDAAWAAAGDAARSAAWAAFKPTTARLQESAQDLVRRMCAVKP